MYDFVIISQEFYDKHNKFKNKIVHILFKKILIRRIQK